LLILNFFTEPVKAQRDFAFRRKIAGVNQATWYTIPFAQRLYQTFDTSRNFRILGITPKGDTVEAPYFWNENRDKEIYVETDFQILNESKNEKGYFFTFEGAAEMPINRLDLNFENENFDWKVDLEGSHNQKEWFNITENQRITAIKNNSTEYVFASLTFDLSNYRYWRICVKTNEKPLLRNARLTQTKHIEGKLTTHPTQYKVEQITQNNNQTVIWVDLDEVLPISQIGLAILAKYAYQRNIKCLYLADSVYNVWQNIMYDNISHRKKNTFDFKTIFAKRLKIVIENGDNIPLAIENITIKGNPIEIVTRLPEMANYYLYYGSPKNTPPQYDLEFFKNEVPNNRPLLQLGEEEILKNSNLQSEPFLSNKWWLWGIMLLIMLFLGLQTFKMMKKMS
jgi:hypothetical protein